MTNKSKTNLDGSDMSGGGDVAATTSAADERRKRAAQEAQQFAKAQAKQAQAPNDASGSVNYEEEMASVAAETKLQDEITELTEKVTENWNLYLSAKAEVENVRRRARIDVENAHKFGQDKLAKELLDVIDSLEKGLEITSKNPNEMDAISIIEGMQLTHKLLLDTMANHGIQVLDPVGQPFDPKTQEALTMQPSQEVKPNHVITVVQKGFTIHNRVLRPARVIVAKE